MHLRHGRKVGAEKNIQTRDAHEREEQRPGRVDDVSRERAARRAQNRHRREEIEREVDEAHERDAASGRVDEERTHHRADEESDEEEHAERAGREDEEQRPGERQPAQHEAVQTPDDAGVGEILREQRPAETEMSERVQRGGAYDAGEPQRQHEESQ